MTQLPLFTGKTVPFESTVATLSSLETKNPCLIEAEVIEDEVLYFGVIIALGVSANSPTPTKFSVVGETETLVT